MGVSFQLWVSAHEKGSHIGRRSYKYKQFGECDLCSRHQFADLVVSQILDLFVVDRQRAINSIDFAIAASGRYDIRSEEMDFGLRQVRYRYNSHNLVFLAPSGLLGVG